MRRRFNDRYINGNLPWDIGRPDFNLVATAREYGIGPGKAIDIGCGTGDNVFWMTQYGFSATGIDVSPKAIEMAQEKSEAKNLHAEFYVRDILKDEVPGSPYDFAFDRGCFHTFDRRKHRRGFARAVFALLKPGGYWLSLIGNVDDGRLETGPPKRSALDVVAAVEPWFEVVQLKQGRFDSNDTVPSKIWICLLRRRGGPGKIE